MIRWIAAIFFTTGAGSPGVQPGVKSAEHEVFLELFSVSIYQPRL
jgi:hypothetical protein